MCPLTTPHREISRPNKDKKKAAPEARVVLLASWEEHGNFHPEPTFKVVHIPLEAKDPEWTIRIGKDLDRMIRDGISKLLQWYRDMFTFSPSEMSRIVLDIMEHKLCVDLNHKLVIQKQRRCRAERSAIAVAEAQKFLEARFIRECQYPMWLSNIVLVKKPNGTWRMFVDFIDLNKTCPKDSYPLPKIDKLVDSMAGHELLSFMDVFSGYHKFL